MPIVVLAEFMYVCRLIYSHTSGLLAVKRTQLHRTLAEALKIEVRQRSNDGDIKY